MQILHPFAGSVTQYSEEISDPDRYRAIHSLWTASVVPLWPSHQNWLRAKSRLIGGMNRRGEAGVCEKSCSADGHPPRC
jgi:hypothetical protein